MAFGPLIDDDLIEQATVAHLRLWWPTYKAWFEDQRGVTLAPVASWVTANEVDGRYAEDALPCIVVAFAGLQREPVKHGDGTMDISPMLAVGAVDSNQNRGDTRRSVHWYGALMRMILLQQAIRPLDEDGEPDQEAEPLVDSITWVHSEPQIDREKERTLLAKAEVFTLELSSVLDVDAGPDQPEPDTDHDSPHTALEVTVETEGGSVTVDSSEA